MTNADLAIPKRLRCRKPGCARHLRYQFFTARCRRHKETLWVGDVAFNFLGWGRVLIWRAHHYETDVGWSAT